MTDTPTPYADRLADLHAEAARASERVVVARRAFQSGFDTSKEVTADLAAYRDAILFRQADATPLADRPARERELTDQFLDAVRDRGLILQVGDGTALRVIDPALQAAFDRANADLREAEGAVKSFIAENAEELDSERKAAEAEGIRTALDSNDADAIREALFPRDDSALTTADLQGRPHPRRTEGV